jgi:hypothetical protein
MGFRMYMLKQGFRLDGGVRFAGVLMCCYEALKMYPLPFWTFQVVDALTFTWRVNLEEKHDDLA